MNMTKATPDNF